MFPQTAEAAFPGTNGRIAYTGWDGNDSEIFTIPATGGTPLQVTHNTVPDGAPSYSPVGNTIAYHSSDGNDQEIFTNFVDEEEEFSEVHIQDPAYPRS